MEEFKERLKRSRMTINIIRFRRVGGAVGEGLV